MDDIGRRENEKFEDEARRIARQLWPAAEFAGAKKVDGRERDGVFETEECIHLLEATVSRTKAKAEEDVKKLVALATNVRKHSTTKAVRCWFITRDEPTADQRKVAEKHRDLVNTLSFSQFQARLVDARAYLNAREDCTFGSVRDPVTGKGSPTVDYIEIQLSDRGRASVRSPRELRDDLLNGKRIVILGDYGAGKSMTMRFLYRGLRSAYQSGKTSRFPVYVNLRDHYGQTEPSEVLERHARTIGFGATSHLVRAWRAGYVHLLLDGFDEVTTINIQGLWRRLQDNRYRAMEAVRRLLREHPAGAGLALSGRAHFFDSDRERRNALGLDGSFSEYSLTEFSDDQIKEYIEKSGFAGVVPQWLPSRPLLVAYLAARGLLPEIAKSQGGEGSLDPADGWDFLLDKIASREAEIEAGIDGATVRRILERLATKARAFQGGLGPLARDAVTSAFQEICGYAPEERGMVLLQRLPGLGIDRGEEDTRSFVDEDFVDACRAGDVLDFISNPYSTDAPFITNMECGIGTLALAIVAKKSEQRRFATGKLNAAISRARTNAPGYLLADLIRCAFETSTPVGETTFLKDFLLPELELTASLADVSRVEFQDCFFTRVGIDADANESNLPRFRNCYIGTLEGRLSANDLPVGRFEECIIEEFSADSDTTNAVLSLDLPLGVRVLITVLKKLYERRGSGRRENALFRGLDHRSKRVVMDVLRLLQREQVAACCKRGTDTIWLPDRPSRKRVGRIIASPTAGNDPLITAARALE
jgi:NACHT domain